MASEPCLLGPQLVGRVNGVAKGRSLEPRDDGTLAAKAADGVHIVTLIWLIAWGAANKAHSPRIESTPP